MLKRYVPRNIWRTPWPIVNHSLSPHFIPTVACWCSLFGSPIFENIGLSELWVGIGSGKHYRDNPVHVIYTKLGPSKSFALPIFHSLTGCDTTSQFLGRGKKTAWAAWTSLPCRVNWHIGETLTRNPDVWHNMQRIERLVVISCTAMGVVHIWCQRSPTSPIPNGQAALFQHVKRELLQASFYWNQSTTEQQQIPEFSDWGWQKDGMGAWQPLWTTLSDAS